MIYTIQTLYFNVLWIFLLYWHPFLYYAGYLLNTYQMSIHMRCDYSRDTRYTREYLRRLACCAQTRGHRGNIWDPVCVPLPYAIFGYRRDILVTRNCIYYLNVLDTCGLLPRQLRNNPANHSGCNIVQWVLWNNRILPDCTYNAIKQARLLVCPRCVWNSRRIWWDPYFRNRRIFWWTLSRE